MKVILSGERHGLPFGPVEFEIDEWLPSSMRWSRILDFTWEQTGNTHGEFTITDYIPGEGIRPEMAPEARGRLQGFSELQYVDAKGRTHTLLKR